MFVPSFAVDQIPVVLLLICLITYLITIFMILRFCTLQVIAGHLLLSVEQVHKFVADFMRWRNLTYAFFIPLISTFLKRIASRETLQDNMDFTSKHPDLL